MKKISFTIAIIFAVFIVASCSSIKDSKMKFNPDQVNLIMADEGKIPMRVFLTTNKSDSILLRTDCENVIPDPHDEVLVRLIDRMNATVNDSNSLGVGIAAPQVGILKDVIWVQRFDKEGEPFEVYLNPKILQFSEMKQTRREGYLSIPDIMDTLDIRSYSILLEYDKIDKSHHIEMVEGFTAIIFQHEIDHLHGKLFIDYIK